MRLGGGSYKIKYRASGSVWDSSIFVIFAHRQRYANIRMLHIIIKENEISRGEALLSVRYSNSDMLKASFSLSFIPSHFPLFTNETSCGHLVSTDII